jgi:demethylmenaquinone methyltransferase / 2-methoxy-6-polyprenyl-1,4-benzoquinol methylase
VSASDRTRHARTLFAGIAPEYERMGAVLGFGQDARWRRFMVDEVQPIPGGWVLDVASGTGLVARELAARRNVNVISLDPSEPMLRAGLPVDRAAGLEDRIRPVLGRAEALPFPDATFDALTFTYLLRYVDSPPATLTELARVVRPGGRVASLEFGFPDPPIWRPLWRLYTRVGLPALGWLFGRDWYEVGRFLEPSIEGLYERWPLERQTEMWRQAGIRDVHQRRMSVGGGVVTWGVRGG